MGWRKRKTEPSDREGVPGFALGRLLGTGGFGSVYLARELERLKRDEVALKIVNVGSALGRTERARFEKELDAIRRLASSGSHPNVITVFDGGVLPHQVWLEMEYCRGGSLADRLEQPGVTLREALDVGHKIALALAHCHQAKVLHRDVKPGNILFTARGEPVLADFGIASVTDALELSGAPQSMTRPFAAPEQLDAQMVRPDERTDIYALAATIYTCIAGRPPVAPIAGEGPLNFMKRVVSEPPPSLGPFGATPEVEQALMAALSKRREDRPASANEFASMLQSAQGTLGPAPVASPVDRPSEAFSGNLEGSPISGGRQSGYMPTRAPATEGGLVGSRGSPAGSEFGHEGAPVQYAGAVGALTVGPERAPVPPAEVPSPRPPAGITRNRKLLIAGGVIAIGVLVGLAARTQLTAQPEGKQPTTTAQLAATDDPVPPIHLTFVKQRAALEFSWDVDEFLDALPSLKDTYLGVVIEACPDVHLNCVAITSVKGSTGKTQIQIATLLQANLNSTRQCYRATLKVTKQGGTLPGGREANPPCINTADLR